MHKMALGLPVLLVLCAPAMARPRDDVMINAYRCAGHAATRVWLDCYYGAAQPQRAALGLPPAPAAQIRLSQSVPALGAPQDVVVRDTVMAAAGRCATVAGDRPWLDCYYAAANPVRAQLGLALMPQAAVPGPVAVSLPARRDPGFLGTVFGTREVDAASNMASYHFDRNGLFTVTLENGQVWQQLDGDGHIARWSKPPHDYAVTIRSGAFKSFNLSVKGNPTIYKVRRIG